MSRLELSLAIIFPATAGLLQDIMGTAMTKTIKVASAAASGKLLSHPPISSWMVDGGWPACRREQWQCFSTSSWVYRGINLFICRRPRKHSKVT